MHDLCMATKTISLEKDAYEKLLRVKRETRESFSSVIRRGTWTEEDSERYKAENVLASLERLFKENPGGFLSDKTLNSMKRRRRTPHKSRWDA
jgi:predicted CopG family antitoxin